MLEALPYTLKMAGLSMVLTLLISVPVGILLAAFQNSALDYGTRGITFVLNAIPSFIIGIFLLYVFAFRLHLIPILATKHMIGMVLPSLTLGLVMSSRYIRQVRAATLDELNRPYVVGLRARGLTEQTILFRNMLKNIMITIITLTALFFGFLLGGTVVSIEENEIVGVIGESGSGKSTLAKVLLGLEQRDAGEIIFDERDISILRGPEQKRVYQSIQMVFQDAVGSFNPRRTIGQALIEMLVQMCGLKAKDAAQQAKVLQLLLHLKEEHQMSILSITHDLPLVSSLANRLVIMKQGALVVYCIILFRYIARRL